METDYLHRTRDWLEIRYQQGLVGGRYRPFAPVFGLSRLRDAEAGVAPGFYYPLAYRLLDVLSRLKPRTLLDVGCGEGFLLDKARTLLGCQVLGTDLSSEACRRAWQLCGVRAVPANASLLPFADDSFDVVVISEVVEHLEFPLEAMAECRRVARTAVVVTTQEFARNRFERWVQLQSLNHAEEHAERYWSMRSDWETVFGRDRIRFVPQGSYALARSVPIPPDDPQEAARGIHRIATDSTARSHHLGMIGVAEKSDGALRALSDKPSVSRAWILRELLRPASATRASVPSPAPGGLPAAALRCPETLQPLRADEEGGVWITVDGTRRYPAGNGVPDLAIAAGSRRLPGVLRDHAVSTGSDARRLLALRARLSRSRPSGGWRTHFAKWAAQSLVESKEFVGLRPSARHWFRSVLRLAKASLAAIGPHGAVEMRVHPLECGMRERKHCWHHDARRVRGATTVGYEISEPGKALPPPRLLDETTPRLVLVAEPFMEVVSRPCDGFPRPGVYEVRPLAVNSYGKILGPRGKTLRVTITP